MVDTNDHSPLITAVQPGPGVRGRESGALEVAENTGAGAVLATLYVRDGDLGASFAQAPAPAPAPCPSYSPLRPTCYLVRTKRSPDECSWTITAQMYTYTITGRSDANHLHVLTSAYRF